MNCVYHSFAETFCSQMLLKRPRLESSSVLKRPSDSNSALFSVTPRDRLVYASGTVRSTASNNAPYIDRKRERHIRTQTHPDTQATWTAHMHRNSDKTQRDTELRGNTYISSHIAVANFISTNSLKSITKCIKVCLCCFGTEKN